MVKHLFQCETCGETYEDLTAALDCERQSDPPDYPVGMIFGDHRRDMSFYWKITFAVARICRDGHSLSVAAMACRGYDGPDSISTTKDLCDGGLSGTFPGNGLECLDLRTTHYRRMYDGLRAQGLTPTVWDGQKAIPAPTPLDISE